MLSYMPSLKQITHVLCTGKMEAEQSIEVNPTFIHNNSSFFFFFAFIIIIIIIIINYICIFY